MEPLTPSQALAQRVRELQARERWTQRDLAKRLGVSQAAVNKLLQGERREGELEFYDGLARVFGLPLSELIAELEARVYASGGALMPPSKVAPIADQEMRREFLRFLQEAYAEYARRVEGDAPPAEPPAVTSPRLPEPPPPVRRTRARSSTKKR